jgi:lytic murein transglycosylase
MRPALAALALFATPLQAAPCGGPWPEFTAAMEAEALSAGRDPASAHAFFSRLQEDPAVLRADHRQGVFQLDFLTFSRRVISQNRLTGGRANLKRWGAVFDRIEATYGVSRGVLTAFWALETDYGQVQGDFDTANALATLAHDCRRPELFQPQLLALAELFERGDFQFGTTGAWAGEIGMVQMLPADILANGVDADGDGAIGLKTSVPDALTSGAKMLASLGWRAGEPWLQEVTVPGDLDWRLTGTDRVLPVADWAVRGVAAREGRLGDAALPASLILPMGRNGPAFLVYPNFAVFLKWNQSLVYVTTAAYFATRLEGASVYAAGNPDPGLDGEAMKALQSKLAARGYDIGEIDGILGSRTRAAVQAEQERLGLPADGWPTAELLGRL